MKLIARLHLSLSSTNICGSLRKLFAVYLYGLQSINYQVAGMYGS